jgi:hypothetical protein
MTPIVQVRNIMLQTFTVAKKFYYSVQAVKLFTDFTGRFLSVPE